MKHFHVITNQYKDPDLVITKEIYEYLTAREVNCTYEGEIPQETDCILVLGGDGTLLRAARENLERDIPLIGVNLGTLGYLAEVEYKNIEQALDHLIHNRFTIEERMMIVGKVKSEEGLAQEMYALNDIVVAKEGNAKIIYYRIYVNGQLLNSYHADGVILSTPTGSTGYSMSAGGPIVEPRANIIVMTPICPHTIYARSIILSPDDKIVVELGASDVNHLQKAHVSFDGECCTPLEEGMQVEILRSERTAKIIKIDQVSFLATLQKKMSES